MNLVQAEQIELLATEINALDIVRRLGEHLANGANDPEHRAKGEAIYKACAELDFVRSDEEDPNEPILRRVDLLRVYEGKCKDIEELKDILPFECANLIDEACKTAYYNRYCDEYIIECEDGVKEGEDE